MFFVPNKDMRIAKSFYTVQPIYSGVVARAEGRPQFFSTSTFALSRTALSAQQSPGLGRGFFSSPGPLRVRIPKEIPPAHIIDEITRREEQRREEDKREPLYAPTPTGPDKDWRPTPPDENPGEGDGGRGVWIIEM